MIQIIKASFLKTLENEKKVYKIYEKSLDDKN